MGFIKPWVILGLIALPVLCLTEPLPRDCVHGPNSRSCWRDGFNIFTDYNDVSNTPPGKLVEYKLTVSQHTISPDGYKRPGILVNGQFPGPKIEADWGDTLRITVHNNLTTYNGTSIHWHGLHQWHNNWQDGVPGLTQCPIKPGDEQVYEFRATQYGTTWYHSHYDSEYTDGLFGPLVIHGPSSINYDIDLGPWMIGDWYHTDVFGMDWGQGLYPFRNMLPPSTILNGKSVFNCNPRNDTRCTGKNERFEVLFHKGTKYKLAVVGAASQVSYRFWIDGHNFTVIEADMVPIEPYVTDGLNVLMGQRYEIVVKANADFEHGNNFWIHVKPCNEDIVIPHELGIVRYAEGDTSVPYSPPLSEANLHPYCGDMDPKHLVPVVKQKIGNNVNGMEPEDYLTLGRQAYPDPWEGSDSRFFKWIIKETPQYLDKEEPSLKKFAMSEYVELPPESNPVYLDFETGEWVYFVITNNYTSDMVDLPRNITPAYHPMHLHGHDFAILAQGDGPFTKDIVPNLNNPARRDVATVAHGGHLWIAFQVNNPGAWMFHCHIAGHLRTGLALQYIEQPRKIKGLMEKAGVVDGLLDRCESWSHWSPMRNLSSNGS